MSEIEKTTCPKCGCNECYDSDAYCFNCGSKLHNYCTDPDCPSGDPDSAGLPLHYCYCPICGSETELMADGVIKPISYTRE